MKSLPANTKKATDKWIKANPYIYGLFEELAIRMASRNRMFGINCLAEVIRWRLLEESIDDTDEVHFKNDYRPYIARRLIADHPQLAAYVRIKPARWDVKER